METENGAHTPGPWDYDEQEPIVLAIGDCEFHEVADCTPNGTCRSHDEAMANARLIAAAPDLLAALESAVRELENEFGTDNPRARQFDTAIAKAKGQA